MAEAGSRETLSTDVLIVGAAPLYPLGATRSRNVNPALITLWRAPLRRGPKTDNLRRQNRP